MKRFLLWPDPNRHWLTAFKIAQDGIVAQITNQRGRVLKTGKVALVDPGPGRPAGLTDPKRMLILSALAERSHRVNDLVVVFAGQGIPPVE